MVPGMAILAGLSAKNNSAGFRWIPQEWLDSDRNHRGMIKTSPWDTVTHEWFWVWHHVWEGVIWSSRAPVLAAGALWLWMFGHVMEVVVAKVEILLVLFKKMRKKKVTGYLEPLTLPLLRCQCCSAVVLPLLVSFVVMRCVVAVCRLYS